MHIARTAACASLLLGSFLACRAPADPVEPARQGAGRGEQQEASTAVAGKDELAAQARERIAAGDFAGARRIIDQLLVDDYLAEARALLDAARPEDGLLALDEVLELAPRDEEVCFQKGRGSLMLAEKVMAEGGSALVVEGALNDALEYFGRARSRPAALFGASRAAWLLGDVERALADAEAGKAARGEAIEAPELRIYSEVLFSAYAEAKGDEARAEDAQRLFASVEDSLSRLLGRAGDDPWVWSKLSDLYEWEDMLGNARSMVEQGLDRAPEDSGLVERLARVVRKQEGSVAAANALAAFNERHGPSALGLWYEGKERFDHALVGLNAGEYQTEELERSEQLFVRCREETEAYAEACRGYEVMCRDAIGWCHYHRGELDEALASFLSMDELLDRGLEWQIEGRLPSGILGLQFVGAGYNEREDWLAAAKVFEILRHEQPEDAAWANNAGFFFRDAAVEQEFLGQRLCQAAAGEVESEEALTELRALAGVSAEDAGTPRERELFQRSSNEAMRSARELMEQSKVAYFEAARLAPDDVRVINDTALILVYYLHTDLERAEELLQRCVTLGEEQLKNPELDEDQTWELKNAWGDAFQNLGVLYANSKNDLTGAARWFERSVEIGPDPRPLLTNVWLPYVRGERPAEDLIQLKTWAEPCDEGIR